MNELVTTEGFDLNKLAGELGAKPKQEILRLPTLKINRKMEDDEERILPRGEIYLDDGSKDFAYSPSAVFRPLSHHFQYIQYDSETKKFVGSTVQISDWSQELRDSKGTTRLGRPSGKEMRNLTKEERNRFKDIKLIRLVRGLVSFTGKTVTGDIVTHENVPCRLKLSGQNNFQSTAGDKPFAPFESQVLDKIPNGYEMWNFDVVLTTKKHKNDTGDVVWWTFEYGLDAKSPQPMTQELYESLIVVTKMIRAENQKIEEAYLKAIRGQHSNDEDVYEGVADDLYDDLEDRV